MKAQPLLLTLLLPLFTLAQEVQPVISQDYLDLLSDSTPSKIRLIDTTNSVRKAQLKLVRDYDGYRIRKLNVKNGKLNIVPGTNRTLSVTGNFSTTIEFRNRNQVPSTQNKYVQGRSANGKILWRGPETNELFSYGPDVNSLEYDGSNYAYDANGKLTVKGTGNGINANVYASDIFRTGSMYSRSLFTQIKYATTYKYLLGKIKLSRADESAIVKGNNNSSENFATFFESGIKWLKILANYNSANQTLPTSNRNGFLNRVYQSSILTPISFENTQGITVGSRQRSYSDFADNPFFLLQDNNNNYVHRMHSAALVLERTGSPVQTRISQSFEENNDHDVEGFKPGTAFFPTGISTNRKTSNGNYYLTVNLSQRTDYGGDAFRSTAMVDYNFSNNHSSIDYPVISHHYQRTAQQLSMAYLTTFSSYQKEVGVKIENKFFSSNTSTAEDFFLPGIGGYFQLTGLFNSNSTIKFIGALNEFNNELPLNSSFAQSQFTQYPVSEAFQHFPVTDVETYNHLAPIRHREWSAKMEFSYKYKIIFQGEIFIRKTKDDVLPLLHSNLFELKNLVDHRNRGIELQLRYNTRKRKFNSIHEVSFVCNKDIVTSVKNGFNNLPIAGFSDINKAIVEGRLFGVLMGNKYLRDANNNVVIGSDGFPLVNNNISEIGNPTPDFIVKWNHLLNWKKFSFQLQWEWKKGGDVWNGTQAVLDFYGRSKSSELQRTTTGYVFKGVMLDGHVNNIPVDFYDPQKPIEQNRWVRYGYRGVPEEYIEKGSHIRIANIGLSYKLPIKKYIQQLSFSFYASNIFVWKSYSGTDPNYLFYDQSNTTGLDFFNLPSTKNFGCNVSLQF